MTSAAVQRLSPRQAECLRHVHELRTSKEIAAITGLSAKTVDAYIAEAVAALGARNRRHAAEMLHSAAPEQSPSGSSRVPSETLAPPSEPLPQRRVGWADLLPLRRPGSIGNDLHPILRLLWIVQLAAVIAIGFGMLAVGGEVLSRAFTRG